MKFIDFFCGMGNFRLGLEQSGHECVYSVEWDKFKRKIYEVIYGEQPEGKDIRNVRASDIPRADVWCFGFPCQDISIAGKQKGLAGNRSGLFFAVTKLIRDTEEKNRPKYLFIENVKNLLSVNNGLDFLQIQIELDEIGYNAEWQVLDSKNFGVPQHRERVFVIGHLRGRSTREVFPISATNGTALKEYTKGLADAFRVYDADGLAKTLKGEAGGMGAKTGLCLIDKQGNRKNKDYASCLTGGGHSGGNHSVMDFFVR